MQILLSLLHNMKKQIIAITLGHFLQVYKTVIDEGSYSFPIQMEFFTIQR